MPAQVGAAAVGKKAVLERRPEAFMPVARR